MEILDKSSMLYWWPLTKGTQVPKPETIIVEIGYRQLVGILDGERFSKKIEKMIIAATEKLGYPVFIRTDQASGKHDWKNACFVEREDSLFGNICKVVEFNELAGFWGLHPEALVFRRFIKLEAKFTAFYGGMPVAKERRYFVRDGIVECHHPYWIHDAIEDWDKRRHTLMARVKRIPDTQNIGDMPKDWREILSELNRETLEEINLLSKYAAEIGKAIGPGYWSVDFAKGKDGVWYFIDMAEGEKSWHPECKFERGLKS